MGSSSIRRWLGHRVRFVLRSASDGPGGTGCGDPGGSGLLFFWWETPLPGLSPREEAADDPLPAGTALGFS